jgi:hypothetical protein
MVDKLCQSSAPQGLLKPLGVWGLSWGPAYVWLFLHCRKVASTFLRVTSAGLHHVT